MEEIKEVILYDKGNSFDDSGQNVGRSVTARIYGVVKSASRSEWTAAGQMGITADLVVTVYRAEYNGEEWASIDGTMYKIYRSYNVSADKAELSLSELPEHYGSD